MGGGGGGGGDKCEGKVCFIPMQYEMEWLHGYELALICNVQDPMMSLQVLEASFKCLHKKIIHTTFSN